MRTLTLLSTGGTIATTAGEQGLSVAVGADDLLAAAERVWGSGGVRVQTRDVHRMVSFAESVGDVLALARAVREAAREADGVVVTHGTDTMEEAAFLVALTHDSPVPVAFTGAQRPFDDPAPDGPRNLAAALRWAADPRAEGTGVGVVFDGNVVPAVGARKVHTLGLDAFRAPGRASVASVDADGVRVHATAPQVPVLLNPGVEPPRVDVVAQYLGADSTGVRASVAAGARGLVLSGFGAGNTTPDTTRACVDLLGSGVPIGLASRVGAGPVSGLYADGGAELVRAGAVVMGDLSPWQARLLLAAALTHTDSRAGVGELCGRWLVSVGAVPGGA